MGCICSKGATSREYIDNGRGQTVSKSSKRFVSLSKKDEGRVVVEPDGIGGNDAMSRLISEGEVQENDGSMISVAWEGSKKNVAVKEMQKRPQMMQRHCTMDVVGKGGGHTKLSRVASVPNGIEVERVVAGWPSWLTAVAAEAVSGWVPRRSDTFEKLEKIGQGTYSSVYRARDLETGKIVAMKKVRFINMDPESVRFMAREIHILRKLDHPNVMKLECLATSGAPGSLYLVFEYMEHDLAGLAARPGVKFTEAQIKCYVQQLICGLEHCHSRGVLHRDIKGSNLLIDNDGNLKIGDFGLATFVHQNQKQPMTSRVVTLWYRPPELLLGSTNYGFSVDLWSAGCILAELFYRKPIMPGRTEVEQLHKIFKLCGSPSEEYWTNLRSADAISFKPQQPYKRMLADTFQNFPPSALGLLDVLLAVEPELRGSASLALKSEFFTTKPLPCDRSTLPKYPPSKEIDARRRDKEARRQKASSGNGLGQESKRDSQQSIAAPDANAELQPSAQKLQSNPKSGREDGGSGISIEQQRSLTRDSVSRSGQLTSCSLASSRLPYGQEDGVAKDQGQVLIPSHDEEFWTKRSYTSQGSSKFSRFPSSIEGGLSSQFDNRSESNLSLNRSEKKLGARYRRLADEGSAEKLGWSHQLTGLSSSGNKDERSSGKAANAGYAQLSRIHCSGPLLPAGVNMEEILEQHEKQIQRAVRKSLVEKNKAKKAYTDNALTEYLLQQRKEAQ